MPTFFAIYKDGVFRPEVPPDLPDGTAVQLTIVTPIIRLAQTPLMGQALLDRIQAIAAKAKPGPPENTSENVDAILYGVKGDPGDVR